MTVYYRVLLIFQVVLMELDLSKLRSVRDFAHKILETESRLDVLINNAGVIGTTTS